MIKIGVAYIYKCYRKIKTGVLLFGPRGSFASDSLCLHFTFIEICVVARYLRKEANGLFFRLYYRVVQKSDNPVLILR